MQVVLLAAGMGLRLGHLTQALPKALISVNQQALIDYTLPHLLRHLHVSEVLVVGGFEFENLQQHLNKKYSHFGEKLCLFENPRFRLGNLYTLEKAIPYLNASFLICNVDHIFPATAWDFILQDREKVSVFCDFQRPLLEDEMKVVLDPDRYLLGMAKGLTAYDAGYVGVTFVPQKDLSNYKKYFEKTAKIKGEKAVVEEVLPLMASLGKKIQAIPFDEHVWYEVDNKEDLMRAEIGLKSAEVKARDSIIRKKSS
jgi:choline kinase